MAYGYCVANALSGLVSAGVASTSSFTGLRSYLNDGRMGRSVSLTSKILGGGPKYVADLFVDLGSTKKIRAVGVLNHNLALLAGGTIDVFSSTDAVSYVLRGYSTSMPSMEGSNKDAVIALDQSLAAHRYWLVRLSTTAASAIVSLGELFFAESVTQLTRAGAYGSGEGAEILAVSSQMAGGERRYAKFGGPIYERRYSLADWSASELAELQAMWTAADGPVTPLLWIDDVEATSTPATLAKMRCLYGHIQDARFDWTQDDFGVYQPPGLVLRSKARGLGQ